METQHSGNGVILWGVQSKEEHLKTLMLGPAHSWVWAIKEVLTERKICNCFSIKMKKGTNGWMESMMDFVPDGKERPLLWCQTGLCLVPILPLWTVYCWINFLTFLN